MGKHQTVLKSLAAALIVGWSANAMAQSTSEGATLCDITSKVLRNADFSADFTTDSENKWVLVSPGTHAYQSGSWEKTCTLISGYAESYVETSTALNDFYLAQTTPQMPKGTYTITLNYNGGVKNVNGGDLMTNMVAFANTATQALDTSYVAPGAGTCSFEYVNTADAPITLGVKTTGETNANWIALDNFKIEYHGTEDEYNTAYENMVPLRRNVSDYLKDYTRYICNASCSYNEISSYFSKRSWSRSGSATGYAEAPAAITSDATLGISYWNQSAQTDTYLIYQTVKGLPAGKYRLTGKAAATVWNNNNGSDNRSGVFFFAGDQQTEVTTAKYGNYTVDFSVANGEEVTMGLKAGKNNANTWCFLSSLQLVRFSDVTLSETDTELPEAEELVGTVTVNRTLKSDRWNTLCLPFGMAVPDGWTVEELNAEASTGSSLAFKTASAIEAGKAYIVKTDADVSQIKADDVNIVTQTTATSTLNYTMTGNLAKQYVPQGCYFINKNTFYVADVADNVVLKGFRAYITAKGQSTGAKPTTLIIDGISTGIGEVEGMDAPADDNYYTLSGTLVKQPVRGLYIHNKKVMIKR